MEMILANDLFAFAARYPNAPALGKTETSREAAEIIRSFHTPLQIMVIRHIQAYGPATWKEVSEASGEDSRNIQPRFTELKELGVIVGTGARRQRCEIYELSEKGNLS